MFGIFAKKSPLKSLYNKYNRLIKEAYELSTRNRRESDLKYAEANEVLKQIEDLKAKSN